MVKNLPVNARDTGGSIPGVGNGNLLQYSCLEKFHGQKSLVGYSPWGHKELNVNEHKLFYLFAYFPSMPLYINTMKAKISVQFVHTYL